MSTPVRWTRTFELVAVQERSGGVLKRLHPPPRTTPTPAPTATPARVTIRKAEPPAPYVSNREWARTRAATLAADLRRADPRLTETAALARVYAARPELARFAYTATTTTEGNT